MRRSWTALRLSKAIELVALYGVAVAAHRLGISKGSLRSALEYNKRAEFQALLQIRNRELREIARIRQKPLELPKASTVKEHQQLVELNRPREEMPAWLKAKYGGMKAEE